MLGNIGLVILVCPKSCNLTMETNSKFFVSSVYKWQGSCEVIYGRARHTQSQGLVEQANGTVERTITNMMAQENQKNWVDLLPKVMWMMNTSKSSTTHFMPYE